jgi:hypothetical protein
VSQVITFDNRVQLFCKRCDACHRWFGTETDYLSRCGSCQKDVSEGYRVKLEATERSNRSLRGALTVKLKRIRQRKDRV